MLNFEKSLQDIKIKKMKTRTVDESSSDIILVINQILSSLKNKQISLKRELSIMEMYKVVLSIKNQINDELSYLKEAGRDLTSIKNQSSFVSQQLDNLSEYLPKKKTVEEIQLEIDGLINEGASSMKEIMSHFKGNSDLYDMQTVSSLAKISLKEK